jgi:hypothetical protein
VTRFYRVATEIPQPGLLPALGCSGRLATSGAMNLNDADVGHAHEVTVEGPNRCVLIGCNGGDQEIRETETLSSGTCALEPVVNPDPRLLGRKEKRKR